MRLQRLLLAMGAALPALACSCASYEPVKACQIFHSTPVIFRGRVIDHNHDPTAGFGQLTLYRFKVLESFKGLAPGTKEVFIDPASMTSCYTQFSDDRDYLIYTGAGGQALPAAFSIAGRQPNSPLKNLPAAWGGLGQLPVHGVGGCSPSRPIEDNDPDLAFLRSSKIGGPPVNGWIEGRAVQNFSWPYNFADFVAATDVTLTVISPSGERRMTAVQHDGTYRIGPVSPGVYAISAASPIFGTGKLAGPGSEVPSGGCAVINASFETRSTISGKVLDANGKPAFETRLELGELQKNGKTRLIPQTWANADRDGNFTISYVPLGRIVMAANLNGAPTARMPFDPVYAPGTQNLQRARVFTVRPGQQLTGLVLQLPKPLLFGDLYVDVKWPDGSPASDGARAFAEWQGARAAFEHAPRGSNRVRLRLALDRKYEIRVDWINSTPGKFLYVERSAPETLDFRRSGQITELQLTTSRPE